jgi:hypothetical protein
VCFRFAAVVLTCVVDSVLEDKQGDVVPVGLLVVAGVDDHVAEGNVLDGHAAELLAAVDVAVGVPLAHADGMTGNSLSKSAIISRFSLTVCICRIWQGRNGPPSGLSCC